VCRTLWTPCILAVASTAITSQQNLLFFFGLNPAWIRRFTLPQSTTPYATAQVRQLNTLRWWSHSYKVLIKCNGLPTLFNRVSGNWKFEYQIQSTTGRQIFMKLVLPCDILAGIQLHTKTVLRSMRGEALLSEFLSPGLVGLIVQRNEWRSISPSVNNVGAPTLFGESALGEEKVKRRWPFFTGAWKFLGECDIISYKREVPGISLAAQLSRHER